MSADSHVLTGDGGWLAADHLPGAVYAFIQDDAVVVMKRFFDENFST